jgi:hypothetical protein
MRLTNPQLEATYPDDAEEHFQEVPCRYAMVDADADCVMKNVPQWHSPMDGHLNGEDEVISGWW